MTKGTIGRVLAAGWLGFLTAPQVSAQAPNCKQWNTDEYFKTATVENVTACLVAGADVNALGEHAVTPLHFAAGYTENPAVIEALLKAGADPMVRINGKRTPLHLAAGYNENPAVIESLLKAGAELEARGLYGETPLHMAARSNENPAVVETLLKAGADVNALGEHAFTPLHLAVMFSMLAGRHEVIEALLEAGADLMARNENGLTPWDLAEGNEALKGSDAYQRLKEARFELPGRGAAGSPPASRVPPAK